MIDIPIEVSARHVHFNQDDLEELFGEGFELTEMKVLSQKGEFASDTTVTIKTPKGKIDEVRVLGPCRKLTQVEISKTDAYELDLNPPMKECTRCDGEMAQMITICNGDRCLERAAAIVAHRHLHINDEKAKELGLKDGDTVAVEVAGERSLAFQNVLVRVAANFCLSMHIDIDEGNAAGIIEKGGGMLKK